MNWNAQPPTAGNCLWHRLRSFVLKFNFEIEYRTARQMLVPESGNMSMLDGCFGAEGVIIEGLK